MSADSTQALSGTKFIANTACGIGGGAVVAGAATLSGALFQNNKARVTMAAVAARMCLMRRR